MEFSGAGTKGGLSVVLMMSATLSLASGAAVAAASASATALR